MPTSTARSVRSRRSRSAATFSLTVVAGLALLGCGGGDDESSESASDTTETTAAATSSAAAQTIAEDAVVDLGVTKDEGLCFGNELVDQLGEDEALALNETDAEFSELPEAQLTAVQVAFNECIPGSVMAEDIVGEFYSSIGASSEPDQAVLDCVATALDGRTGDVALEGMSVDTEDADLTVTAEIIDGCIPREVAVELFVTSFTSAGLSPEQAQCTAEQVAGQISLSQLVELGSSSEALPPEIQAITDEAVAACL
jgi:hypothetical protein